VTPAFAAAAQRQREQRSEQRQGRIEDYQFINGDRLTAKQAAARIGVSNRTVQRYRQALGSTSPDRVQRGRRGACARWHGRDCRCWQTGADA
jgi:predicted DNA-binding transcriptional regulator YafY